MTTLEKAAESAYDAIRVYLHCCLEKESDIYRETPLTNLWDAANQLSLALSLNAVNEPIGWLCSPDGHFKRNLLYRIDFPPESLAWQVPIYAAPQQGAPVVEPEHWVVTTKVGDIVGFRAPGLKKGDKVYPHPQQAEPVAPMFPTVKLSDCAVCGIGAGKVMGYVCQRGDCPSKVTCGGNPSY
jgi:hypothetical protein